MSAHSRRRHLTAQTNRSKPGGPRSECGSCGATRPSQGQSPDASLNLASASFRSSSPQQPLQLSEAVARAIQLDIGRGIRRHQRGEIGRGQLLLGGARAGSPTLTRVPWTKNSYTKTYYAGVLVGSAAPTYVSVNTLNT